MYIKYDEKSGMRLAMMREVWVCPKCGMEGEIFRSVRTHEGITNEYRCVTHPAEKLVIAHHMVPDPCEVEQDVEYSWDASNQSRDSRAKTWTANYEANVEVVTKRSVFDLPTSDKVYIVGAGPSAKQQGRLVNQMDDGVVVAMSRGIKYVKADYFLALDHVFKDVPKKHARGTTAILAPVVNPELARLPWSDVRWIASRVHNPLNDRIRKKHPKLWGYMEGLNVTYVAMQLAATVFRAKHVVLVGIDCCFCREEHHVGEKLKFEPGLKVVEGPYKNPCITNDMMAEQRNYMIAQVLMMQSHGVKVEVAGQDGIIPVKSMVQQEVIIPRVKLDG